MTQHQTSLLGDPAAEGEVDVHQLELLLAGVRPDVADAGHGPLEGGRAELPQLPRRRDVARRLRLASTCSDCLDLLTIAQPSSLALTATISRPPSSPTCLDLPRLT